MGNNVPKHAAREKGKSARASADSGKNVDVSGGGGGGGGVEGKEPEASTSLDTRAATSHMSRNEANDVIDKKERKGQKSSSKVVLENKTDKVLVLREKVRSANGCVRHQIEANSSIDINTGPHSTYYRLLVYAIEVKEDTQTPNPKDTGLTVDSDRLCDAAHIVISKDEAGTYSITSQHYEPLHEPLGVGCLLCKSGQRKSRWTTP